MYDKIKYYYDKQYYTKEHISIFVQKGVITSVQYKSITGDDYV